MSLHPPVHHPKNLVLGFHRWDETVPQRSVYLVSSFFFLEPFIFTCFFCFPHSHFFRGPFFHLLFFFGPTILEPKFFSGNSYLLLQPTYLPPSPQPQRASGACGELLEPVESLWRAFGACGTWGAWRACGAWDAKHQAEPSP